MNLLPKYEKLINSIDELDELIYIKEQEIITRHYIISEQIPKYILEFYIQAWLNYVKWKPFYMVSKNKFPPMYNENKQFQFKLKFTPEFTTHRCMFKDCFSHRAIENIFCFQHIKQHIDVEKVKSIIKQYLKDAAKERRKFLDTKFEIPKVINLSFMVWKVDGDFKIGNSYNVRLEQS